MRLQALLPLVASVLLTGTDVCLLAGKASAQVIDFSNIHKFESMATGTQRGASPPKVIVDDGERHMVFVTILEANTDAKVYWRSLDGNQPRETTIRGPGVQAFQTAGEFRLEAVGDESRSVKYGYLLFALKNP